MNNKTGIKRPAGTMYFQLSVLTALLALPLSMAFAGDRDGDGLDNAADNCVHVVNPGQRDADADGFGNRCDPDFNNNGLVDHYDLAYMRNRFYAADALADLNSDGVVDFADLAILKSYYGDAPGGMPRTSEFETVAGGTATILLQPEMVYAVPGGTFSIDVIMDFDGITTIGGGFDVAFDSSSLSFVSWAAAGVGDPGFAREPDIFDGLLSGIGVGDFNGGITGVQNIGTLEFQFIGGDNVIIPGDTSSVAGPFVDIDTFQVISVDYFGATVTEGIPEDPTIAVEPETVDFGFIVTGETGTAEVTISSTGQNDLVIGNVAENDELAAPFSLIADTCSGQTLEIDATCAVTVQFAPSGLSGFMDSFDIPSNATEMPVVSVTVAGEGIPVPDPQIEFVGNASPLDLGRVQLGQFGERFLRLRNAGTSALVIGDIGDTDALDPPFAVSADTCSGASLSPQATCQLRVRFEGEVGGFVDSVNIPSNDTDTPQLALAVFAEGIPTPPSDFGGTVRGLGQAALVTCVNITTGQRVAKLVGTFTPWSCHNVGLTVNAGDSIGVLLSGFAQ